MEIRPRFAILATSALIASFGIAACGDDDEDTAATPTPAVTQTAEPTTEEPAAGGEDIVALAQATPELSTLVQAVTAAELVETLQGEGPFTVFAPTNDAFTALGEDTVNTLLEPENKDQLTSVLTYHVVPGAAMAADLSDGQELETVNGETLTVSIDGDTVKVGDATVVMADVEASNGVVHVIDTVLQP